MSVLDWKALSLTALTAALAVTGGCGRGESPGADTLGLTPPEELGATIASVAAVGQPRPVAVEGYGLVGGLAGTGSADCPPAIRTYLKRYILARVPGERVDADELIGSENTAVVSLTGLIPAAALEGERFDVGVSLVPGSQATSLHGGWLYEAELVPAGTSPVATRALAVVEGGVFVNRIGTAAADLRNGYILGGGRASYDFRGQMRLRRPSFTLVSQIRNRLNDRYGGETAQAVSSTGLELRIPESYQRRRLRFVRMVEATYLVPAPERIEARINTFVHRLAASEDKEGSEVALEAMGPASLEKLSALLSSSSAEVRFRAARVMRALGGDRALATLREIALDEGSPYRLDALEAVAVCGDRTDAVSLATRLLRDREARVVLAAYEHLRSLGGAAVRQIDVGRSFCLEHVAQTNQHAIFVARRGAPRVAVFGAPVRCRDSIFVESPDGDIVVDSRIGRDYVAVMRKHPSRPGVLGPLRTGFEISDIIIALGAERDRTEAGQVSGLGASYTEVTTLLERLVAKDAVAAEFWPGPLPEIGRIVKKP